MVLAVERAQANALGVLTSTIEDSSRCTQSVDAFSQLQTVRSKISTLESRQPKSRAELITKTALRAVRGLFFAGITALSAYGLTKIFNGKLFDFLTPPSRGDYDFAPVLLAGFAFLMLAPLIAPPLAIGIGVGVIGLAYCIYKIAQPFFEKYQLNQLRAQEKKLRNQISAQPTGCKQAERCLDLHTGLEFLQLVTVAEEAKEREQLARLRVQDLSRMA